MSQRAERILEAIAEIKKEHIIIGIDGRCASGKTHLADELAKELDCNVFHTDDFFLPPEQRTHERYTEPDGNLDRERFLSEVIEPLKKARPFSYRPFNCYTMTLGDEIATEPKMINIIEGSYSCQESLRDNYDLRVFLNVDKQTQLERLFARNGTGIAPYIDKWIPFEERYFNECEIEKHCDISLF